MRDFRPYTERCVSCGCSNAVQQYGDRCERCKRSMKPLYIGICDECGRDKPIVLVCLIGQRLCGECQEKQNRISHEELSEEVARVTKLGWY